MDEETDEYLKEFLDILKTKENNQKIFYHFTSAETFENIIKSNRLWFSYYKHLNDSEEIFHGYKLILKKIASNQDMNFAEGVLNKCYKEDMLNNYLFSLTKTIDNLALWRLYADKGCGIAIGFEINSLWNEKTTQYSNHEYPLIGSVYYDNKSKKKKIDELFNKFNELKARISPREQQKLKKAFSIALIFLIPLLKHTSFNQEKELRACLMDGEISGFHFPIKRQRNICKENSFTKYSAQINGKQITNINYHLEKRCIESENFDKIAIKEIWIGPQCNFEIAKAEITSLLKSKEYNHDIKIRYYEAPLRE